MGQGTGIVGESLARHDSLLPIPDSLLPSFLLPLQFLIFVYTIGTRSRVAKAENAQEEWQFPSTLAKF